MILTQRKTNQRKLTIALFFEYTSNVDAPVQSGARIAALGKWR